MFADSVGKLSSCTGVMSDLLSALSSPLNFTVLWTLPPDGLWGSSIDNRTAIGNGTGMSGIVGELNSKEADLSTGGLYMTSERQVKEEGTAILFICHFVAEKKLFYVENCVVWL